MDRRTFLKGGMAAGMALTIAARVESVAADTPKPPNVLWIMLDDCRPDVLGCYGRPWAWTPNFDGAV